MRPLVLALLLIPALLAGCVRPVPVEALEPVPAAESFYCVPYSPCKRFLVDPGTESGEPLRGLRVVVETELEGGHVDARVGETWIGSANIDGGDRRTIRFTAPGGVGLQPWLLTFAPMSGSYGRVDVVEFEWLRGLPPCEDGEQPVAGNVTREQAIRTAVRFGHGGVPPAEPPFARLVVLRADGNLQEYAHGACGAVFGRASPPYDREAHAVWQVRFIGGYGSPEMDSDVFVDATTRKVVTQGQVRA